MVSQRVDNLNPELVATISAHRSQAMVNSASIPNVEQEIDWSQKNRLLSLPTTTGFSDISTTLSGVSSMILPPYILDDIKNRRSLLYFPTDDEFLSEQQIFIRKQIEFFESALDDVGKTSSGRKHPTMLNQVGIQCRHCATLPIRYRERGAVYFPAKLVGIYQASQNIAASHMIKLCQMIDIQIKEKLMAYKHSRAVSGHGGKKYWAETAKAQGVIDSESGSGLRFKEEIRISNNTSI
jgi:hypothetical protein